MGNETFYWDGPKNILTSIRIVLIKSGRLAGLLYHHQTLHLYQVMDSKGILKPYNITSFSILILEIKIILHIVFLRFIILFCQFVILNHKLKF